MGAAGFGKRSNTMLGSNDIEDYDYFYLDTSGQKGKKPNVPMPTNMNKFRLQKSQIDVSSRDQKILYT